VPGRYGLYIGCTVCTVSTVFVEHVCVYRRTGRTNRTSAHQVVDGGMNGKEEEALGGSYIRRAN
jgi:hypothetical protein